jgi:hypothetical protein
VLQEEARGVKTERVDDSGNQLEEDPLKGFYKDEPAEEQQEEEQQEEEQGAGDSLEEDELSNTKK